MSVYNLTEGNSPLIISIPHAGLEVPQDIEKRLTPVARTLPDTDFHVDTLYADFITAHDATAIKANFSRYVIDMNRAPDDAPLYPGQAKIPLCPDKTFAGAYLYTDEKPVTAEEQQHRLETYWQPYHDALAAQIARIKTIHGYALLYDAHSIRSAVPRLFDGQLPDLNLGTVNGQSCDTDRQAAAFTTAQNNPAFTSVLNGRFIGGYITRHYGNPQNNIHALQMELAQSTYMNEDTTHYDARRAEKLKPVLENILLAFTHNTTARIKPKTV